MCVHEGLLHGVEVARLPEALDRGDRAALGTKRRHQAGVYWLTVQPHGTGAAVAGVTAFFDPESALVAEKGAEALSRKRLGGNGAAIDRIGGEGLSVVHVRFSCASSARICSAK